MPTTPYLSAHTGAEVDAAVLDVPILRGEMDRFTDFTGFTGSAVTDLDSIVTTALAVGSRAFVVSGNALYVFVLTAGTDAENSPTVVRPDDFALTTNEKVWKWQAITEAAEITGPGSSVDNGIARWNGTGGTAIQNSPITIDDTGFITVTGTVARLLRSTNDNVVSIIGGDSKTNASFVDFSGDTHATTSGRIGFTTKGTGTFRVVNAALTTLGGTEIFSIGADGSVTVTAKATAQVATFVAVSADPTPYTVSFDKSRTGGVITTGDCLGAVRFRGHSGAGGFVTSAQIRVDSTGTIATTQVGSSLILSTATSASPSVLTDAVWITNQQRIGIGTAAPGSKLEINANGVLNSGAFYVIGTTALSGVKMQVVDTSGGLGVIGTEGGFPLSFITNNITRVSLVSGVNVGIGPSLTPGANLDVNNGTTATKVYIYRTTDGAASPTDYARLAIDTTASATATFLRTEAGGTGFTAGQPRILQVGTGPSSGTNIAGQNVIWHAGQGTGSALGGSHLFQVAAAGSSGIGVNALATAMTIDGNGLIGISTAPVAGQRLTINTTAMVGIGTGSGILSINGGPGAVAGALISFQKSSVQTMAFGHQSMVLGGTSSNLIFYTPADDFVFYGSAGTLAMIKGTGNFGIGPSFTPGANLDINNTTTTTVLRLYHTTNGDASPANYSRLTLSHNAAGTGKQTVNFLAETGGTGDDNISIRLAPAGTGGLYLGPVADGTATGGNARGDSSVDLQLIRGLATHVASGASSCILGGYSSIASGSVSTVAGGNTHTASGANSTCVGGANNTASAEYATCVGGQSNVSSGKYAVASGLGTIAGKFCQSTQGVFFTSGGDAQSSVLTASRITTDATANVELFLDGTAATARCTIATDTSWTFKILLVARRTDGDNETANYEFTGGIDNNAGVTALAGAVTKTVHNEDTVGWDADVVADNTFDSLKIQVTGAAANIRWVARIELVEVTG